MNHLFESLPSSLPAYVQLLWRPRRYVVEAPPSITASVASASFDGARLARYRELVVAPADGLLPPFAPQLLAAPLHLRLLADRDFPFAALGLVHLENRIEIRRPVAEDEPLALRAWLAGIEPHRLGHAITLTTEACPASAPDAEPIWVAETVALARGRDQRGGARSVDRPRIPLEEPVFVDVPEATGRAYARVAGDLNPIHQHALLARPFGFRRAIVHGTWTAARAISLRWPDAALRPAELSVRFRTPVFLPSRIHIGRVGDALVVTDEAGIREHVRIERRAP